MSLYLNAIQSPYAGYQVPEPSDTIRFLKICSCKNGDINNIESQTVFDRLLWLKMLIFKDYHSKVISAILLYIKQYTDQPKIVIKEKESGRQTIIKEKSTIPDFLMLATLCMSKLHISEDKVMNLSISKLSWYGVSISAMEGADIRIISEEEEEASKSLLEKLSEFEMKQAQKLRTSMINGKIKKRKIIIP